MKRIWIFILFCVTLSFNVYSQSDTVAIDSTKVKPKLSFFQKLVNYLNGGDSAKQNSNKAKWLVLGGPHYSTDSKLGLALYGIMEFRLKGCDFSMQPSNFMAGVDVSTAGFWSVSASGTILFPHDSKRINAELSVGYSPQNFWGMGYEMGNNDANESKLRQNEIKMKADMIFRVAPKFYLGPSAEWRTVKGKSLARPELLEGQDHTIRNYGFGFALQYDSRDLMRDASRGAYIHLKQMFYPKFLWNHYAFASTDFRASVYHKVWKGGVIAGELRGLFNVGNPSWANLAQLGDNSSMRGYYKGRFRDKHSMAAQVELRQHVWKRNGVVAWVGVGNVFHDANSFGQLLPNFGIGYRFALRPHMNIRLDYGWGKKGHSGFVMAVYESF